jgi:Holliday junction resolvase RusA-like endonuclease
VRWVIVVPGAPPSVNHSYKPVRIRKDDGRTVMRMAKHSSVLEYQVLVAHLTKLAKPRGWEPTEEYIRLTYRFFLQRSIDSDNAMKALNDGIAGALGVNDKRFLPCVISMEVSAKQANPRVEVEIGDPKDWSSPPATSSSPSPQSPTPSASFDT